MLDVEHLGQSSKCVRLAEECSAQLEDVEEVAAVRCSVPSLLAVPRLCRPALGSREADECSSRTRSLHLNVRPTAITGEHEAECPFHAPIPDRRPGRRVVDGKA